MFDGDRCQTLDLAIVGFLAPCLRETRIALEIKSVSVATDRDDDLRSIRLPFRAKSRIGQPSAKKCAASARTIHIYAAPLAPQAVRAPCAPGGVDFRDTHDFTAARTGGEGVGWEKPFSPSHPTPSAPCHPQAINAPTQADRRLPNAAPSGRN